jgi:hypothetical protein
VIRTLLWLLALGALIYLGATVDLGKRTFFGHVANVWTSQEAKELREDVGKTTAPVLERAKRGAKAGWDEYRNEPAAGSLDAGAAELPAPADALATVVPGARP